MGGDITREKCGKGAERDPHAGYLLRGRLHGLRSLRVGSYRIIYQLTDSNQAVRVAAIRHRAAAYRTDPR